jgi:gas vesicle protein
MRRESDYVDDSSSVSTKLLYFIMGGSIGAVVALLFAPKSGFELRGDIADATRKSIDRTRETAAQVGTRVGEVYENTVDRANELYSSAAGRATDVVDSARDVANRKKDQLGAAIEAGKQAYRDEKRKADAPGALDASKTH